MATLGIGPDAAGRVVLIDGGRITALASARPDGIAQWLDADQGEIGPGDVNAHTHLYSGLAPYDLPAPEHTPVHFRQILERVWWRLDRALDADSLAASARDAIARALLAGTTAMVDHHESPDFIDGSLDVLAAAAEEMGVRLLLTYGATERNGGLEEANRGLDECRRFVRNGAGSLCRGAVGLHASFTVSDETLRRCGELARELAVPVHVHVAEAREDVADARGRGYGGPLERLLELDSLPAGSILAHGVHLSAEQVVRAADQGLWFVQNPRSNENNDVGYPLHLGASANVALGTDGFPADMEVEEAALARLAGTESDSSDWSGRRVASRRLAEQLFGVALDVRPGAAADLVVRDAAGVRHVVVDGRVVVRERELTATAFAEIEAASKAAAVGLWERMTSFDYPV